MPDSGSLGSWENLPTDQQKDYLGRMVRHEIEASTLVELFGKTVDFYGKMASIILTGPQTNSAQILFENDATPVKTTIITDASRCKEHQAIMEIIDNIFDNSLRENRIFSTGAGPLEVRIEYFQAADMLIVSENSGGIPFDDMENLVTPGLPGRGTNEETIGVWGRGFKIALFALGNQVSIATNYPHDNIDYLRGKGEALRESPDPKSRGVIFTREWMTPVKKGHKDYDIWRSWKIYQCQATGIGSGCTNMRIEGVSKGKSSEKSLATRGVHPLMEAILMTYGQKLLELKSGGKFVRIILAKEPDVLTINTSLPDWGVEDEYRSPPYLWPLSWFEEKCMFPPSFTPMTRTYRYTETITDALTGQSEDAKLEMKVTVCLLKKGDDQLSGFWLYGNGRHFAHKIEAPFFGSGGNDSMPQLTPPLKNLVVMLEYKGNPTLIPWRGPLKDEFSPGQGFEKQRYDFRETIIPYAKFKTPVYGTGIEEVFCSEWNTDNKQGRFKRLLPIAEDRLQHQTQQPYTEIVASPIETRMVEYSDDLERKDPVRFSKDKAQVLGTLLGKHKADGSGQLTRVQFLQILFPRYFITSGDLAIPKEAVKQIVFECAGNEESVEALPEFVKKEDILEACGMSDSSDKDSLLRRLKEAEHNYVSQGVGLLSEVGDQLKKNLGEMDTVKIRLRLEKEKLKRLSDITKVDVEDKSLVVTRALDEFLEKIESEEEDTDKGQR